MFPSTSIKSSTFRSSGAMRNLLEVVLSINISLLWSEAFLFSNVSKHFAALRRGRDLDLEDLEIGHQLRAEQSVRLRAGRSVISEELRTQPSAN
jgi:hypothetical protein